MIPSYQTAIPDKEDLNHGVPAIGGHGNDVLVFHIAVSDFLLLGDLFNAVQKIPVFDSFFEFHGV